MTRSPQLSIKLDLPPMDLARLSGAIQQGIADGTFLGHGLLLEQSGPDEVRFSGSGDLFAPGVGEGVLGLGAGSCTTRGVRVEGALWCPGIRNRCLVQAAAAGAVTATAAALLMGWLMHWSLPLGLGVAVVWDSFLWRARRRRLMTRVTRYLMNLHFLAQRGGTAG